MSEHSIFGESGGAERRDRPVRAAETRRPNPTHGLFGARLFPDDHNTGDDDERGLPVSRN